MYKLPPDCRFDDDRVRYDNSGNGQFFWLDTINNVDKIDTPWWRFDHQNTSAPCPNVWTTGLGWLENIFFHQLIAVTFPKWNLAQSQALFRSHISKRFPFLCRRASESVPGHTWMHRASWSSIMFENDTKLAADVVVFATGWVKFSLQCTRIN